jgi:hypothetical protein
MQNTTVALNVLTRAEDFWRSADLEQNPHELLKFSAFLGLFPFAGYLFSYTIVGKIWSSWPFIQTTLTVPPALIYSVMQWILFVTFPFLSSVILELLFSRWLRYDWNSNLVITTYSLAPLNLALLFAGVPFVERVMTVLGLATFLYLQYYGYRIYLEQSILRSAAWTLAVLTLFIFIRQMFVFVIGF